MGVASARRARSHSRRGDGRIPGQPSVARIRERLDHPVIDSDGHLVEFRPVAMEYIAKAGGKDMAEALHRGAAFDVSVA